jgi:hypothetical protein
MEDLWGIYGGFKVDLWRMYGGFVEGLWRLEIYWNSTRIPSEAT